MNSPARAKPNPICGLRQAPVRRTVCGCDFSRQTKKPKQNPIRLNQLGFWSQFGLVSPVQYIENFVTIPERNQEEGTFHRTESIFCHKEYGYRHEPIRTGIEGV